MRPKRVMIGPHKVPLRRNQHLAAYLIEGER